MARLARWEGPPPGPDTGLLCQWRQPSLSTSVLKPFGMRGASRSLVALQGAPAPPQLQARSPSHGISGWFSQTQPLSSHRAHFTAVAAAGGTIACGRPDHVDRQSRSDDRERRSVADCSAVALGGIGRDVTRPALPGVLRPRSPRLRWRCTYTDSGARIPTYSIFSSGHPITSWTGGGHMGNR
jgi:hypothetical protein